MVQYHESFLNKPKRLPEIVKLQELVAQERDVVKEIWTTYHRENKRYSGDTISTLEYQKFKARAEDNPFFALPVFSKQGNGFTVLVTQYSKADGRLSVTGLNEYNVNPTSACPYMIIHLYTELSTLEQSLVLVRAEHINENFDKAEVERIWRLLKRFYLSEGEYHYVERFNKAASSFDSQAFFDMLRQQKV